MGATKSRMSPISVQRRRCGYTLVEMLIVVSLIALIAALAAPAINSNDEIKLDGAAGEVAALIRFAQAEAIRTGNAYGAIADTINDTVRAYRLDENPNPPVIVYDVINPLTKQPYDLKFGSDADDVAVEAAYFKYVNYFFPMSFVGFSGETGLPKFNDAGTIRMLENGYIRLGSDGQSRTISVAPVTGRVTIQ